MMKTFYSLLLLTVFTGSVYATEPTFNFTEGEDTTKAWTFGGFTSLQLNQVALVNWNAGGENSFSATGLAQGFANYKKGLWTWDNRLDLGYGVLYTKTYSWQKNEDKIDFLSKATRSIGSSKFSYAGELNFKTQFAPGYQLPDDSTVVSRFMAPGYLLLTLGINYNPVDWISFYLSPATGKFTFVTDPVLSNQAAFGVDTGKVVKRRVWCLFPFWIEERHHEKHHSTNRP